MENNNIKVYFFLVFNKKYNMMRQLIILKNAEYGCAIPFLLGFSQVLKGNVYSLILYKYIFINMCVLNEKKRFKIKLKFKLIFHHIFQIHF